MKKMEELYEIQMIYDIILGQRYVLVPMKSVKLLPRAILDANAIGGAKRMPRANNGKNR